MSTKQAESDVWGLLILRTAIVSQDPQASPSQRFR